MENALVNQSKVNDNDARQAAPESFQAIVDKLCALNFTHLHDLPSGCVFIRRLETQWRND